MTPPDRVRVVSWDVDGTLYSLWRMSLWLSLLLAGSALSLRFWRGVAELRALARVRRAIDRVRAKGGVVPAALLLERRALDAVEARWYGRAIARAGLRPGVRALLGRLEGAGIRQVVLSDYEAGYKLAALGVERAFAARYAGEARGLVKPAPALFRGVIDAEGIAPAALLHIGDRAERDGGAAAEVGYRFERVSRGWVARVLAATGVARG